MCGCGVWHERRASASCRVRLRGRFLERMLGEMLDEKVGAKARVGDVGTPYIWDRETYGRAERAGVFGEWLPTELLDGEVLNLGQNSAAHREATGLVIEYLQAFFPSDVFVVQREMPVALDAVSQPEPDASVVRGRPDDFADTHPASPVLVIEVADGGQSADFIRTRKLAAYGRNGVPEFWIVNLADRQIEVHRGPDVEMSTYRERFVAAEGESVAAQGTAGGMVEVAELLP